MDLLVAEDVGVAFGGVVAVDAFSLRIPEGALVGLIGPNGAGKTTFIDALTGFVPSTGHVTFAGTSLDGMPAHRRIRAGLGRTFQSVELFADLTVAGNLRVHADAHGLRRGDRAAEDAALADALELVGLTWAADHYPDELPHGTRRLVSIARSLAASPRLLLLDEPAAGLEASETRALSVHLRELVERRGLSILLVDHDMDLVLGVCDLVYVLNFGKEIAHGPPAEIRSHEAVLEAYLGGEVQSLEGVS